MRHFFWIFHKKSALLTLLAVWIFCWMLGGMAHLTCHLEEDAKLPQPAAPHPCLICHSHTQTGRSDILLQNQRALQPVFVCYYVSRSTQSHPAAQKATVRIVPNRGPPSLLRI